MFIAHHNIPLQQIGEEVEGVHIRVSDEETLRAPHSQTKAEGGIVEQSYFWHRLVDRMDDLEKKDRLLEIGVLGFADDTSAVDKLSNRTQMTETLRRRLGVNGEIVHPDKDEFMAAGK